MLKLLAMMSALFAALGGPAAQARAPSAASAVEMWQASAAAVAVTAAQRERAATLRPSAGFPSLREQAQLRATARLVAGPRPRLDVLRE